MIINQEETNENNCEREPVEEKEESHNEHVDEEHFDVQEPIDQRDNENGEEESKHDSNADSDSESDDDINVVIGDIKSGPSYAGINVKQRAPLLAAGAPNAINLNRYKENLY
ncbi:uncharacterized protein LOC113371309 [Ctenocephalides felis]|uniref:uncharacterized protein LOC113371309 n=1 Tax=Ctenocephalides felis TaxID=7515 RepID=UPI000E6E53AE|nr:uncharacterized protein LOC113371309 [Ctenocephalides felis]